MEDKLNVQKEKKALLEIICLLLLSQDEWNNELSQESKALIITYGSEGIWLNPPPSVKWSLLTCYTLQPTQHKASTVSKIWGLWPEVIHNLFIKLHPQLPQVHSEYIYGVLMSEARLIHPPMWGGVSEGVHATSLSQLCGSCSHLISL